MINGEQDAAATVIVAGAEPADCAGPAAPVAVSPSPCHCAPATNYKRLEGGLTSLSARLLGLRKQALQGRQVSGESARRAGSKCRPRDGPDPWNLDDFRPDAARIRPSEAPALAWRLALISGPTSCRLVVPAGRPAGRHLLVKVR